MNSVVYDVVIVGGGAVGCAIARELSRYCLKIAVIEKEADVACGTSGRNSAVVHAGFNNKPGSLMAEFCVKGNLHFEEYAKELDIPYNKTGKLLVAFNDEDMDALKCLYNQGLSNGSKGLKLLTAEQLHEIAPYVNGVGAMLSANTAIINPFLYTVALAENAHQNGVEFFFSSELTGVCKCENEFVLQLNYKESKCIKAKYVINSAGLYADKVSALFGVDKYAIHPCRGEYLILDKSVSQIINIPVYPAPRKGIGGLGIHVTPTSDGNVILGPSAEYIEECNDYDNTYDVMSKLLSEAQQLIPNIKREDVIGLYTGIRAKQAPKSEGGFRDFVIKVEEDEAHLINLIGIESPGLTASIPIAEYVVELIRNIETMEKNPQFVGTRKAPIKFSNLSEEEQEEAIKNDSDYGVLVCRCEGVTRREIKDAIENPLGTVTIAGIKNRTRSMTGKCQGGVCLANITQILMDEYGYKAEDIVHRSEKSYYFEGKVK